MKGLAHFQEFLDDNGQPLFRIRDGTKVVG